jgi:hypothetical protein
VPQQHFHHQPEGQKKDKKNLKPTGAAGSDGISTKLLQNCADEVSPVLAVIYRKSIISGTVPADWKTAMSSQSLKRAARPMPVIIDQFG